MHSRTYTERLDYLKLSTMLRLERKESRVYCKPSPDEPPYRYYAPRDPTEEATVIQLYPR